MNAVRAALLVALVVAPSGARAGFAPLRLAQTIPLPGVSGRLDHLAVDIEGRRLFVAALGAGSLEVVDLASGARVRSIPGFHEPQGVLYIAPLDRIVVTGGADGACDLLDGRSFARVARVRFSGDADNVRYDQATGRVYVGYGDGALGVVDPKVGRTVGDVRLAGHPESFQIDRTEGRIFVNVPAAGHVAVVDPAGAVSATWPLGGARGNFPMALDEADHRLFVGTRRPARLLVFDTRSGREVAVLESSGDADDLFYDARHRRVYVSGGEGLVTVYAQQDPDHYRVVGRVPTAPGARTSLFVPEQGRLYVAAPEQGGRQAEILVYETEP
jgi:hypothetical protein